MLRLVFSFDGDGHLLAVPMRSSRPLTTVGFLPVRSPMRPPPLKLRAARTGVSRDSADIHAALVSLGYVHRYTRPLAASTVPPAAEVITRVVDALVTD